MGGGGSRRWQSRLGRAVVVASAAEVLGAVGGIPGMSTCGPGQLVGEGVEEKVEAPHQYHDVVGVTEKYYHH